MLALMAMFAMGTSAMYPDLACPNPSAPASNTSDYNPGSVFALQDHIRALFLRQDRMCAEVAELASLRHDVERSQRCMREELDKTFYQKLHGDSVLRMHIENIAKSKVDAYVVLAYENLLAARLPGTFDNWMRKEHHYEAAVKAVFHDAQMKLRIQLDNHVRVIIGEIAMEDEYHKCEDAYRLAIKKRSDEIFNSAEKQFKEKLASYTEQLESVDEIKRDISRLYLTLTLTMVIVVPALMIVCTQMNQMRFQRH